MNNLFITKIYKKFYNFLLGSILFLYPFGIYGIRPLDIFNLNQNSYFISFCHLFLIVFVALGFVRLKKKNIYLILLAEIFIFLPVFTLGNDYLIEDLINYDYFGSINSLFYLSLLFIFGVIIFDQARYDHFLYFLKIILLAILISSIFHILQFMTFVIFKYKLYALFCDQISLICGDSYLRASKYNYMGELMRSSGFVGSTNRSVSYLIPGLFLALLFYNKSNNRIFIFIYLIISLAALSTLSRLSIFLLLFNLFVVAFFFFKSKNYLNIFKNINFNSIKFTLIFFGVLILFIPGIFHDKFNLLEQRNIGDYTRVFQNLILAFSVSFQNFGLGVGYHIIDDYLFFHTDVELWGSHSNMVQLIGGLGIFFTLMIFYLLFNNFKKINLNKITILTLALIVFSFFIIGLMKTYFLNIYGIFFLSILLKLCSNNNTTIKNNIKNYSSN